MTKPMDELDLVRWLRGRLAMGPDVLLGPGDDCALLDPRGDTCLAATIDTLLEGTHFQASDDPYRIGWKTAAVSLSDLAAMGCRPRWALTGLGLRRGAGEAWIRAFAEGLIACANAHNLSLVGGDITSGAGPTSITLTAWGSPFPGGPVKRSGARPGDLLAVTGRLGGSILGKHLDFIPRLAESAALCASGGVTAMIDLSDGLGLDLTRLCEESGVGARIEAGKIPIAGTARARAEASGQTPLSHALCDGEDFELLCALRPEAWEEIEYRWHLPTPLTRIGVCTPSRAGLCLIREEGREEAWPGGGYRHALD